MSNRMWKRNQNRNVLALSCVAALASLAGSLVGCGRSDQPEFPNADIANVVKVRPTFGPEFKVRDIAPTGIDPKVLAPQKLPPGVRFQPPDCAKLAQGQPLPRDLQGNMAATAAEGAGNRFIVLAVETSQSLPFNDPGENCKRVKFAGAASRGQVDVVDTPQIDGVRTVGTHRILQTLVQGKPRIGELYNYVANFGPFTVIVTANPLVIPGKPLAHVDTQRARDLLTAAVAAVKG